MVTQISDPKYHLSLISVFEYFEEHYRPHTITNPNPNHCFEEHCFDTEKITVVPAQPDNDVRSIDYSGGSFSPQLVLLTCSV